MRRPIRTLLATVAVGLSTALVAPAVPAQAAPPRTSPLLFGLHQNSIGSGVFPDSRPGTIRLWDSGTLWRDIARTRTDYDFDKLDTAVATTRAKGSQVLLVLGQTPQWASARPDEATPYGPGAGAMPRQIKFWREYVTKVVKRYKGRVKVYQVWNEANLSTFWTGTPKQMAWLTREAKRIVDRYDPGATLLSPSFGTRRPPNVPWMGQWLKAGGAKHVDAIALHLYPNPWQGPEGMLPLLAEAKAMLAKHKVRKPIWNTEINYGAGLGGAPARRYGAKASTAYVARTYLLTADAGVRRAYWYGWDSSGPLGIKMTEGGKPAAAGTAFSTVRKWMVGAQQYGCTTDRRRTYTCTMRFPGGWWGTATWNPSRSFGLRVPDGVRTVSWTDGSWKRTSGGKRVQINGDPVLLRSPRRL